MYPVEMYTRVRRACLVEGMSVREASRVFGLHRDTVRKMLAYSVPPGYRSAAHIAGGPRSAGRIQSERHAAPTEWWRFGTYHQFSVKHLDRYIAEVEGRHNHRPSDTIDQMSEIVRGMDGKRLRYDDLVH